MAPIITFVGGGSYQWIPKLLIDVVNTRSLAGAEIVLHDIDPAPLPRMAEFVEHMARLGGTNITVRHTTDRRDAVRGADYVVVCISTGALDSMACDISIPDRFGIKQTVGDTVGPGGIVRALRNIPVMVGIARDIEELAPDAWLLNLTNPMTTLTRAVQQTTGVEAIGLCHEVTITQFQLSLLLDCDMRAMDIEVCGVNHFPLITALTLDEGRDGLGLLADKLADEAAFGDEPVTLPAMIGHEAISAGGEWTKRGILDQHRVKLELFRRFGALPAAGDRHLVEFFPGFITEQSKWGARWGVALTSMDDRRQWLGFYMKEFEGYLAADSVPQDPSGEMVAALIDARLRDKPRAFPLNIANTGQCPDLPDGAVVECMATVDASGVAARDVAQAPPLLGEYTRRISAAQELTVEAGLTGDRDLVFEAMLADPLASRLDYDALWTMTNEMIDATARWLPQFA